MAGPWGIPGGAIRDGETAEKAARRETREEIDTAPGDEVAGVDVQDRGGGWTVHVIRAGVGAEFTADRARQSDATGWSTKGAMGSLPHHPGMTVWLDRSGARSAPRTEVSA